MFDDKWKEQEQIVEEYFATSDDKLWKRRAKRFYLGNDVRDYCKKLDKALWELTDVEIRDLMWLIRPMKDIGYWNDIIRYYRPLWVRYVERGKCASVIFDTSEILAPTALAKYAYDHFEGQIYLTQEDIDSICQEFKNDSIYGANAVYFESITRSFYDGLAKGFPDIVRLKDGDAIIERLASQELKGLYKKLRDVDCFRTDGAKVRTVPLTRRQGYIFPAQTRKTLAALGDLDEYLQASVNNYSKTYRMLCHRVLCAARPFDIYWSGAVYRVIDDVGGMDRFVSMIDINHHSREGGKAYKEIETSLRKVSKETNAAVFINKVRVFVEQYKRENK